jgi:TonB family protein
MKRPPIQVIAAVIGFVTALAAFNFLKRWEWAAPSDLKQIGQILSIEGQVERRLPGSVHMETVPGSRPLYHQDLVVTQPRSSVSIVLEPNGPTIHLNENSRFIAELDASKPGAFIGTLLAGGLAVLNPGRKDLFRLFRDGQQVALENADRTLVPVIPEEPSAVAFDPSATTTPSTGFVIVATQSEDGTSPKPETTPDPHLEAESAADSGVLTNDDIVKALRNQTGLFQRCYLSYIHRTNSSTESGGRVTLSFTVKNTGRVHDAKVVRSDFKDVTLHNCVKEVTQRTRFKTFRGNEVPVQEFPISLQ